MVVAGTCTGKGVSRVIPAIIDHDGPVAVIDIKGENFAICTGYRASLERKQIVLNPFHVMEDHPARFDPSPTSVPSPCSAISPRSPTA